jgi:hypothetical protein
VITRDNPEGEGLVRISCVVDGNECVYYDRQHDTTGDIKVVTDSDVQRTAINFIIPPKKHAYVTLIHKEKYHKGHVRDAYFTNYPVINAQLTVNFPIGYRFKMFQSMSSCFSLTMKEDNREIYNLEGAIMPKQGYVYELHELPTAQAKLPLREEKG